MKKESFSLRRKARLLSAVAVGALLLSSCAQDGFDEDERWSSSVKNTQLESPAVEDITIEASADGAQTIISWPVVEGAGGYICSVLDVSDAENPAAVDGIQDSLIDRCTIAVTRAEDTNYKFVITTAGNDKFNNKQAETATEVAFTTFTESYASIPAGADLAEWFANNTIDGTGELCFDLEGGAEYYLSKDLDFYDKQVTLRSNNRTDHAKIKITADASFMTSTGLSFKYIDFDCSASTKPLIRLSATPDPSIQGATGSGDYYNIMQPITINTCNVDNMRGTLYYDNKQKYCASVLLITNSVIHFTLDGTGEIYDQALISAYSGHINNFTVQNSTFYNTGSDEATYFVRYNNSGRCTRAGYTADYVNYRNCTLYNIAKSGQMANYGGLAGQASSNYTVTNNIFVDCGGNEVARRIVAGRVGSGVANFSNNTYMFDNDFTENLAGYDNSGTDIKEDPGFANPAQGDFTISGATQISRRTGDPRWIPAN